MGLLSLTLILLFLGRNSAVELTLPESCGSEQNTIEYLTASLGVVSLISKLIPVYGETIGPALSGVSKVLPYAVQIFGSSNDDSINIWDCLQPRIEELAKQTAQNQIRNYIDTTMKGRLDKIQRQMDILNDVCQNKLKCLTEIKNIFDLTNDYSPTLFTDPSDKYLPLIGLNYLGAFSTLQYTLYSTYTYISIDITGSTDITMDSKFKVFLAEYLEHAYEWFPILLNTLNQDGLSYNDKTDKLQLYWSMVPYCHWKGWYLEIQGNEKYFKKYTWNEIMQPKCPDIIYQLISKKYINEEWITSNEFETMKWGNWRKQRICDHTTSTYAFQHKLHQHGDDNTGTNGIKFICSDNQTRTSGVQKFGKWGQTYYCSNNGKITGYKLYVQSKKRGAFDCGITDGTVDDWSVSGIAVICRDINFNASVLESNLYKEEIQCPVPTDKWTDFVECFPGYSICGIQSRVQKYQSNEFQNIDFDFGTKITKDNTALNNIRVKCCLSDDNIPNIGKYEITENTITDTEITENESNLNGILVSVSDILNITIAVTFIANFLVCILYKCKCKLC